MGNHWNAYALKLLPLPNQILPCMYSNTSVYVSWSRVRDTASFQISEHTRKGEMGKYLAKMVSTKAVVNGITKNALVAKLQK